MDDAALAQAAAVEDVLLATLGDGLLGLYLYGSAVAGGLRPDSDLDLFAVSSRRTTAAERRALVTGLTPISWRPRRPPAWRPVELTIAVASDLKPWRSPPRTDFQYGEWLREDFDAGRFAPSDPNNPDLAVLVTMVRRRGVPRFGPPADELLDPVPPGDLVTAMVAGVDSLLADLATDTRNVLLTLARIWVTTETGEILSKDAAADWALTRLAGAQRAGLARARAGYLGEAEDRWEDGDPRATALADRLVSEIRRASGA
jgi:streptomycin 3"-adenylyltransferase